MELFFQDFVRKSLAKSANSVQDANATTNTEIQQLSKYNFCRIDKIASIFTISIFAGCGYNGYLDHFDSGHLHAVPHVPRPTTEQASEGQLPGAH